METGCICTEVDIFKRKFYPDMQALKGHFSRGENYIIHNSFNILFPRIKPRVQEEPRI